MKTGGKEIKRTKVSEVTEDYREYVLWGKCEKL